MGCDTSKLNATEDFSVSQSEDIEELTPQPGRHFSGIPCIKAMVPFLNLDPVVYTMGPV